MSAGAGKDVGEGSSVGEKGLCSYCGKPCAKRLCAGCLSARYCGDKCRQKDWKQGHGTACPKDRCLEPSKQPAPAEPRDGAPSQLDKDDGPAAGPTEHDPADLEALPGDDLAQRNKEGAPGQLDEQDAPAEKSAPSQSWVNNDEPLYEGTYREILQARARHKHDGSDEEDLARAKSLIRASKRARDRGQHEDAMGSLVRALEISMDVGEVVMIANCYEIIGGILCKQGKLVMALRAFNEELRLHRALGNDAMIVPILNNVSIVHIELGEYQAAIEGLEEARRLIGRRQRCDSYKEQERTLELFVSVYQEQGNHSLVLENVCELLRIRTQRLGGKHPQVLETLHKMTCLRKEQEKLAKELEMQQDSLKVARNWHGNDHPDVGKVLYEIGVFYLGQGKYVEAKESFLESLRIMRIRGPVGHADVGIILNLLGQIAYQSGDFDEALQHFEEALKLLSEATGKDNAKIAHEIATVHFNIATVHKEKRSYQMAKEHFGAAAKILTRMRGPGHSETKNAMQEALECARM